MQVKEKDGPKSAGTALPVPDAPVVNQPRERVIRPIAD